MSLRTTSGILYGLGRKREGGIIYCFLQFDTFSIGLSFAECSSSSSSWSARILIISKVLCFFPIFLLCHHRLFATRAIRTSMNLVSFGPCYPLFQYRTREERALSLEVPASSSLQNQFARVSWLLSPLWNILVIFHYMHLSH